jgi:hypothetical protein
MKLSNIDMRQRLPLWIPITMITFAFCGMVWITWRLAHAL